MTITNGYTTLAALKLRINSNGLTTNANDDGFLEDLITRASRRIDKETKRQFFATSATYYFDTPDDPYELFLEEEDLLTITTLTNGDGTTITSGQYKLYPLNDTPKYRIQLLPSSGVIWQLSTAGNREGAISINGTWGYASSYPADIQEACEIIAYNTYRGRTYSDANGQVNITAAGLVVTPLSIPGDAARILQSYKRLVM